ncbi:MurR/RpiR family transcriptional regulator [Alicyclobacillus fastidiosus]|uniref:MurR/RpiR family transcriptional regulator n=1 Tax=Alicyclobacillus fastidiosus TaxID=392011 RepID=A0ABY6ZLQ4_9BACL|nr:MurR/RpiR family transcriptional regulator [Alicyclobacillus fastidiosus]WAH43034.1 MurR/RpiR family transcriptional regulator [Alicyclobacillus fastidiosus]GMA65014.1 putative HTH-type transcriptional regulator [Alicyclobacillus fastidiosus]
MVPSGGLIRLREALPRLSDSEARIAEFIIQNPSEFVHLTIQELASRSQSSPAAAVRLWKSLGFTGYQEFKIRVASDVQSNVAEEYSELKVGSSFASVLRSVEERHLQSIQNTLRLLDESAVAEAVRVIHRASKVMAYGIGASGVVAEDLAQKLTRIGFPVYEAADFHKAAVLASHLNDQDVLVLLSHSGATSEVVEVAEIAKRKGAHLIAVTCFGDTPLSRIVDTKLYVSAVEPEVRLGATTSRMAALTVIDVLLVSLANQFREEIYEALEVTRNVVKSHKFRN